MNVYNNMIVNNVSTHEGGGISLNDAPNVRVYNNTVMKNLTTATAVTSDGQPAPAGLSTSGNSDELQATLPAGSPDLQQPAAVQQHLLGQPRRHPGRHARSPASAWPATPARSTTGTWACPTAPARWRRRTRSSSRPPASTRTRPARPTAPPTRRSCRRTTCRSPSPPGGRTRRSWTPRWSTLEAPPNQLGDYHLSGCPASPACNLGASPSRCRPTSSRQRTWRRPPSTSTTRHARRSAASTAARTSSVPRPRRPRPRDLYFSTFGNTNPPGVAGTADDADIYTLERHVVQPVDRRLGCAVQPAGGRQRGRLRPGRRHALLPVLQRRHHRAGLGSGAGRGRRVLQRRHLVGLLRRHGARSDRGRPGPRRDQRRGFDAVLLDGRATPTRPVSAGQRTMPTSTA